MRLCRFDENHIGLVSDEGIHDVTGALAELGSWTYPLPEHDVLIANLDKIRPALEAHARDSAPIDSTGVRLLSPVANPGKVIAAPVNYLKHLQEAFADKGINQGNSVQQIQKMGFFLKATSAVAGPGEGVRLIKLDRRNDHELELAVIIGKTVRNVSAADALGCVAGYCIGLDITIRGAEERSLRKSPDSYAVLGPWMVTADELPDPSHLDLLLKVNGEVRQEANTSDLVLDVAQLIEFASSFYTLHPGDVMLTGTPQGVGPIKPGDVMDATIEGIGTMQIEVHEA